MAGKQAVRTGGNICVTGCLTAAGELEERLQDRVVAIEGVAQCPQAGLGIADLQRAARPQQSQHGSLSPPHTGAGRLQGVSVPVGASALDAGNGVSDWGRGCRVPNSID